MFSIEQSLFLRALGQAISHSLWQMAFLWLVYAAISNVGKWSSNLKYKLAAGASLAGFVWFVVTFIVALSTLPPVQVASGIYAEGAVEPTTNLPYFLQYLYHSTAKSFNSLLPYISCAYLLLFVVLSIRLSNGFRQVKFFATQGLEKTNIEWRLFVQQHATALGITKKVKIFASQHVQSPLTLGFWKPIILLPVASLSHLTTAQVESILLHELAHIRRHDYLVNVLLQIAEISLFFNPFMRLLLKQVKQERENSCDDYVLQFQYNPKDYAKALLAVEHNRNTALLALAAKGNQSFQLLNRVKRMVAPQPKAFSYRQQLSLLLLFTILTLGFTIIVPHPKKAATKVVKTVAKKLNKSDKTTLVITTDQTTTNAFTPPPPPPSAPAAYDIVSSIANYASNAGFDEKELEASTKMLEIKEAELEALGKEIEAKAKPLEAKWEAWGKRVATQMEKTAIAEGQVSEETLKEIQNIPAEALTIVDESVQRKILSKVGDVLKVLPGHIMLGLQKNAQAAATKALQQAAYELKHQAYMNAQALKQMEQDKKNLENTKRFLKERMKNAEADTEKEVEAHLQRLNLGLLTDDRDTTITGLKGLVAKASKRNRSANKFNFSADVFLPQNVQINSNNKCVITVSENDIKFTSDDESNQFSNTHINGQNIDVRHEKQMKNGKPENVVIISISASK